MPPVLPQKASPVETPDSLLKNLTVIELGAGISTAYAGRLLADLGARVVKLESPGGDPLRAHGPFPGDQPDPNNSGLDIFLNAGKDRRVGDLDDPSGRRELDGLLASADVLLDNRSPAEIRRLGLDEASLRAAHPRLVAAHISIFGQTGPYADFAAHDLTACAASGASAGIGIPGRPPLTMPFQQGQYQGGLAAASGAIAALLARRRTGRGQLVDISIAEVWSCFFGGMHAPEMIFRGVLGLQMGWRSGLGRYPQTILPCKDGYVSLSAPQKEQWLRFVDLIGRPEWTANPRYRDRRAMGQEYPDEVDALLTDWLQQHTKEEIFSICRERRIPFAPVRTMDELVSDPQLEHRSFYRALDVGGQTVKAPRGPWRFQPPAGRNQTAAAPASPGSGQATNASGQPAPPSDSTRPLDGIRVVNFGTAMAGPLAAQILCDLGAEVIKIESRKRLDGLRRGRPLLGGAAAGDEGAEPELQPMFHALNRGERSLTIDFKDPEGWAVLRDLIRRSDVIVENFSPGVLDRAGFGWEKLSAEQPDLIILAMSAVGQTGPLSDTIAYAPTTMALGGITGVTGYRDGRVLMPQIAYGDVSASLHAVFAVLAALEHRAQTGEGRYIDFAQEEATLNCLAEPLLDYQLNGRVAGPHGNDLPGFAPHNTYQCRDDDSGLARYVSIAVRTDKEWYGLVQALGSPAWAQNPDFATAPGRWAARDTIDAHLGEWTADQDAWEVTRRLQEHGVAAFPVQNVQDEYFDPHYQEREVFVHVDHPIVGTLALPSLAWRLSETPGRIAGPAPTLGDANDYILREVLALPDVQIERLAERGVLT